MYDIYTIVKARLLPYFQEHEQQHHCFGQREQMARVHSRSSGCNRGRLHYPNNVQGPIPKEIGDTGVCRVHAAYHIH